MAKLLNSQLKVLLSQFQSNLILSGLFKAYASTCFPKPLVYLI